MTTGQSGKRWKWPQIIQALLITRTIAQAAEQAGVSERTVQRLLQNPLFMKEWSEARATAVRGTTDFLIVKGTDAAETLDAISKNIEAPAGARVMAADRIILRGREGFELQQLEKRVGELERQFAQEEK